MTKEETLEALHFRCAVKKFDPKKKLSPEQIDLLQEALRLTPSSAGMEPWKFLFITDQELKQKLKSISHNQSQVADAPLLVVLCAKNDVTNKDIEERFDRIVEVRNVTRESLSLYEKTTRKFLLLEKMQRLLMGFPGWMFAGDSLTHWTQKQTYIALGNLLTVCAMNKIDVSPMEGFIQRKYKKVLKDYIKGYSPVVICAVGFRAEDDWISSQKKVRLPKERVITSI